MTRLPTEIRPEAVTAIIDTREQCPLDLAPLRTETATLPTGDYSVRGMEHEIAIERKSEGDLLSCVGKNRERFEREIQRLLAYPVRAIVVESTWHSLEAGEWQSKITPAAAVGSVLGWVARGIPVVMAGNHERAGRVVSRILYIAARRRWRELRTIAASIASPKPGSDRRADGPG